MNLKENVFGSLKLTIMPIFSIYYNAEQSNQKNHEKFWIHFI